MKIYIGHSTDLEYMEKLYEPLKDSSIGREHEMIFPHDLEEFFNSREFLKKKCDLFVAEVSKPSTGLGIELGWADIFEVTVLSICQEGNEPSSALEAVTEDVTDYRSGKELVEIVENKVRKIERKNK